LTTTPKYRTFLSLPFQELYENDSIAYMMSCNYYPKPTTCEVVAKNNTRLSAHTDVSLFSTFPFGIPQGFSYFNENEYDEYNKEENMVMFTGYFSEFLTNGATKALNHQVELPLDLDTERYSFAIFSIPKPNNIIKIGNQQLSGNEYYTKYLSLF